MTDITELAQREKFEAWFKSSFHPDKTGPYIKDQLYFAWKAAGAEMVEALEKAQTINAAAEKLVRCKGRYHSEQNYRALAVLFGVKTPDLPPLEHENVHYADAAEMEIEALRQRIAELESRTVKLPDLRQIVSGDRYVWSDGVYNYSQDVKVALAAAGIKVEVE
ncbi:Ead domain protein [Klebsiella pneumoniae]|nr:Ead domain protein [Klebsiella pneumoniae]HCD1689157.1 ead/Ea22-like family protein [Klebsiella pneumoniae]